MIASSVQLDRAAERPERLVLPAEARQGDEARRPVPHLHRGSTRRVENHHVDVWQNLKSEALRAHEAFVNAARGAKLARHRGEDERAEALTRLARKQHVRWLNASRAMAVYEL